jgi:peptidoglycan/LPS O-acetylase OafA/YrhL
MSTLLDSTHARRGASATSGSANKSLHNLDVLRAIAVLLVLFAHSVPVMNLVGENLAGTIESRLGRIGVLFFFVHTSLVLMMSLEREQGRRWVSRFYLNRAFRIYPLSVLCVVLVVLFRVPPVIHKAFTTPSLGNITANLLLIQNLVGRSWSLSGPLWSLPFELQMYLLLPPIFVLTRKHGNTGAWILVTLSLVLPVMEKALFRGTWITEFFPCFMGGIIAYATFSRRPIFFAGLWPLTVLIFVTASYASGLDRWLQWAICIGLGLMIPMFRDLTQGHLSGTAHLVARYSYGIYLSHMPLRWLCFQHLDLSPLARWIIYIPLVSLVSFLLYHLVEAPMIRLGKSLCAVKLSDAELSSVYSR